MAQSIYTNLDMLTVAKVVNLPTPTADGDAANKAYVDANIEGLAWKDKCIVSTQGNLNLAAPGAAIDGITMVLNDRVLVRQQTSVPENGIYIWNGAAVPATRSLDANTSEELEAAVTTVDEGSDAGTSWRQTSVNFTINVGNVVWASFGTAAPPASETVPGIAEIATQAETDAGVDDLRIVTPLKLNTWSGRKLKYSANLGDGVATQYTLTHNLNTLDLQVQVFRNSGNYDNVLPDIERTSVNAVRLTFSIAPTANQFRCVILG